MITAKRNVFNSGNVPFRATSRYFRMQLGRRKNGTGPRHSAQARRTPAQAGTLVQTVLLSLNSAGEAFDPVAVAEKPKLWLEPGPM